MLKKILLLILIVICAVSLFVFLKYRPFEHKEIKVDTKPSVSRIDETPEIEIPTELTPSEIEDQYVTQLEEEAAQLRKQADELSRYATAKAAPVKIDENTWKNHQYYFNSNNQLKSDFYGGANETQQSFKLPKNKIDMVNPAYRFEILTHQQYEKIYGNENKDDCEIQCILLNGHIFQKNLTVLNTSKLKEIGHFIYRNKSVHIIDYRHYKSSYHGGIGLLSVEGKQIEFNFFSGFREGTGTTLYRIRKNGLEIKMDDQTYQSIIRFDDKGFSIEQLKPYPLVGEICSENDKGEQDCEMMRNKH